VHSNAFMSNMIYVKKPVELIIFMSVAVGPFWQTETCRTFLLCAFARANYIDVNTARKTVKQTTGSLLAIRCLLFLIGLMGISSIKAVFNMHLGVH
jgi:hypothetical protein